MVLRALQSPFLIRLDGPHEGIRDQNAVMEIGCLAVRITAGGAAHFDKLLDLRMTDRQIDGSRATAQAALADGQGQTVHDPDEGYDARCLAVDADLFADRTQVAPVAADAAPLGRQPDVFGPQIDDRFEAVVGLVQKAGDRQAAFGAAVRKHRRGRHEPELRHVIVEPLGVRLIVTIEAGNPGEEILIRLAGHQITILKGCFSEIRQ